MEGMTTCRAIVRDVPWTELPEAPGLSTKVLLHLPEEGLIVHVNNVPAEGAPEHAHPTAHLMYVIEGRGELWAEDIGSMEIEAGAFVFVPPGRKHHIKNVGGDLQILNTSTVLISSH
jgi:quercetin dioxygenase-like cupin family protein